MSSDLEQKQKEPGSLDSEPIQEAYTEPPETLGEFLLRHREASGKSLDEISRSTRVSKRYLLAFESDDLENYPESPFDRGFLRNYAMELGLDPEECLDRFDRFRRASLPTQIREIKKPELTVALGSPQIREESIQGMKWIAAGVIALVIVGALVWWMSGPSSEETAKAPEVEVLPESRPGSGGSEIQRMDTPNLPPSAPHTLELEATKKVTLVIRVDSLAEQEILLEPGQLKQIEFRNKVSIDGKDRSQVKMKMNGESVAVKDQAGPTVLYSPSKAFP
jgi:cytoskeletal protein RodZ